jgi:hypothetical protein
MNLVLVNHTKVVKVVVKEVNKTPNLQFLFLRNKEKINKNIKIQRVRKYKSNQNKMEEIKFKHYQK